MRLPLRQVIYLVALLLAIAIPLILHFSGNYYAVHVVGLVGVYCILALGLNITIGYTGLLDLGFMAFYAIGAYTGALLSIAGWSFWLILPISVCVGALARYLIGAPVLRLRGDYLAIVTLAFGEITRLFFNNYDTLSNGPKGLPRVGEKINSVSFFGIQFTDDIHFYYLVLVFVMLGIFVSYRMEHSRLGRALVAIREDELAAELTGINVSRVKMIAFVISGAFGALAGTIYVHWIGFVTPETFTFWESVLLVSMIVLGGMGNISGVLLGVVLLVGIPEVLRASLGSRFVDYRMLLFGAMMILVIIFRPQGLLPSRRRAQELSKSEPESAS